MNGQAFMTAVRFFRRHWVTSLFITASIGFLVWRCADFTYGQTPCPTGVAPHAPHEVTHETCPSLGRMNGVKLAIPQHYLLGPKGYKGVDIWSAESYKKRPQTESFDNELDNFAVRIRLINFKPIETFKDTDDYGKLGSLIGVPPPENRWIHVGIEADDRDLDFKTTVAGWLKDEAGWGPFVAQPEVWGLKRYLSSEQPSPDKTQWEFFYNDQSTVFANCQNNLMKYPPYGRLAFCKLQFFAPELRAKIIVSNIQNREDLARWAEIEREVRKVIQSFIVH